MKKKPFLTAGMFTSRTDEWTTPAATFEALDAEFHFTLDPCSSHENARCKRHYTKEDDGLTKDWSGHRVFVNPPYGKAISAWIKKCSEEAQKPETTVVALLPARTDTRVFHDYIYGKAREIRFVRGRRSG